MPKILLVEDEVRLARVVEDWLGNEGHTVEVVNSGTAAIERFASHQYDLLILDVNLPGADGIEVCRRYREKGGSAAVIMLTGQHEIESKESALDSGADDYVTKPFQMRELSARIRAVLRRSRQITQAVIHIGDLVLDSVARRVTKGGEPVKLMPREFALLSFFMQHPNEVFSTDALLDTVWQDDPDGSPDTVRVHITRLRAKIDSDGVESYIKTLHKQGYRFAAPNTP